MPIQRHFKTMPDYGADSETPIQTGIFRFLISPLPAVLISGFFGSSVVSVGEIPA